MPYTHRMRHTRKSRRRARFESTTRCVQRQQNHADQHAPCSIACMPRINNKPHIHEQQNNTRQQAHVLCMTPMKKQHTRRMAQVRRTYRVSRICKSVTKQRKPRHGMHAPCVWYVQKARRLAYCELKAHDTHRV